MIDFPDTIYYFAYGSNMDEVQMKERCPWARKIGVGYIPGYELFSSHYSGKWKGGVFSIKENTTTDVFGIIYDVTPDCIEMLDIYEGYPHVYRKEKLKITQVKPNKEEKNINCVVYISNHTNDIEVSEDYLDLCQEAADYNRIPLNFK